LIDISLAIAPIFLLIVLGHVLRRGGIPSLEFWNLNDKLVYWVLFPALLFYKMATMELSGDLLGRYAFVIYSGLGSAIVFSLIAGHFGRLERPTWTSVVQGCARHNTFIALAVSDRVFGAEGLAIAAIITALLIPMVTLIISILRGAQRGGIIVAIVRDLLRNPLLIAVLLGISVNLSGVDNIPVLYEMTSILGGAALPIVLLCVGANIRIRKMAASVKPTLMSIAGKMLVFPMAIALAAWTIGLGPNETLIAMIFGAAPSASGAYTLARQMGGDAPTMATIITVQTTISFITLPLTIMLAQHWLGL